MMDENHPVKSERNDEHNACAAARLTAQLPSAIATIAVAGATATGVVQALVQLQTPSLAIGRIHYGRWPMADGNSEQVVVCRTDAVTVEVHCHGGQAVCQAILSDLQRTGCRVLPAEEWSVWRAEISQPMQPASCPIQQAAEHDLLLAQSERAAAILLDQANGALRAAVERLLEQLDRSQVEAALHELSQLLERSRIGLRLTTPWQVVLAGPPNVGKSSLSNALAGQARAIVHHEPGTTRDWLQTLTTVDGWPVALTDTAGVRLATDRIEAEGVARARQRIAAADGVLLVVDGTLGWTTTHDEILAISQAAEIERFIVWNKGDLTTAPPPTHIAASPVIVTSAVGTPGIEELIAKLAQWLCPCPPEDGVAIPFRPEHVAALKDTQRELLDGKFSAAMERMQDLLA
jgi:tRNA modification GTPase